MERVEIIQTLECLMFDLETADTFSQSEQYALIEGRCSEQGAYFYKAIGSLGTEVDLRAGRELPREPFIVMRSSGTRGKLKSYQAITVSALDQIERTMLEPTLPSGVQERLALGATGALVAF